jgi:hypothetical protein
VTKYSIPSRLPDDYKSLAIQGWLNAEQRDKIAVDNGLSAGSVTNIVNEWRVDLGLPSANALRELGETLKRVGIAPSQCALGFRTATLMHRIGAYCRRIQSLQVYWIVAREHCFSLGKFA